MSDLIINHGKHVCFLVIIKGLEISVSEIKTVSLTKWLILFIQDKWYCLFTNVLSWVAMLDHGVKPREAIQRHHFHINIHGGPVFDTGTFAVGDWFVLGNVSTPARTRARESRPRRPVHSYVAINQDCTSQQSNTAIFRTHPLSIAREGGGWCVSSLVL